MGTNNLKELFEILAQRQNPTGGMRGWLAGNHAQLDVRNVADVLALTFNGLQDSYGGWGTADSQTLTNSSVMGNLTDGVNATCTLLDEAGNNLEQITEPLRIHVNNLTSDETVNNNPVSAGDF